MFVRSGLSNPFHHRAEVFISASNGLFNGSDLEKNKHMKNKLITLILLLVSSGLLAQGLYNNGGKIVISPGAYLYICGTGGNYLNETNAGNAAIALGGTLKIDGNYTNNVAGADVLINPASGSEVALTGTSPQTLGGTTTTPFTFANLLVNNNSGIYLANDCFVNGNLTLNSGLMNLETANLTMGATSTIGGTPSASSMVVATGTGELRKTFAGTGSFTFPVGDNNGTPEFSPVMLNFLSGAFAPGSYVGISLSNTAYPDPLANTSYLSRYWNVSQSGITGFSCNGTFNYVASDVVGTETDITAVRISPAPAEFFDPANALLHQLTANNLSSFGSFTGVLGFRMLTLKLFFEGLYTPGGTMNQAYDDFGPHFGPGIADVINVDLHDPVTFSTIHHTLNNVEISTTGTASIPIPGNYNGSYYISFHHRNSIETITGSPVNMGAGAVNYDFTTSASQAFGNNMKQMSDGAWVLFGGDANGDGAIDGLDLIDVENQAALFGSGYIMTDANGDGVVDGLDLILVENNAFNFISVITP